jgi:23S rRNA U2552 (ribose-2'-O)-methylase RlmE/FtsJ
VKKEAMFNLLLAKSLPQVKIVSVDVRPVKKEPGVLEVVAVFTNEGFLPTALEMAERVKIVNPDRAEISFPEEEMALVGGKKTIELGRLRSGEKKEARWKVKPAKQGGETEVFILSTRGGVARQKVKVG